MADGPWFAPELSLSSQMEMEIDRRAAARMIRNELAIKADELIQAWYQHREAIQRASREIAGLQCKLALAETPCTQGKNPPRAEHYQWAQEVLGVGVVSR
jgi:hypothetical protein